MERQQIVSSTPLIDAIRLHRPMEEIKRIAKEAPDVKLERLGKYNSNALIWATTCKYPEDLLFFLIEEIGFNINETNELGQNLAFYLAGGIFCKSFYEVLREKHNLQVRIYDKKGNTPLSIACRYNNKQAVESLLESGLERTDNLLHEVLNNSYEYTAYTVDILKNLIKFGGNINYIHEGETLFHTLARNVNVKNYLSVEYACHIIRFLLDSGLEIDALNSQKETPLIIFAKRHDDKTYICSSVNMIFEMLLDAGANPNHIDKNGNTPLKAVIENPYNCPGRNGSCSGICEKAEKSSFDCPIKKINLLTKYGADINYFGNSKENPLLKAIQCDNIELVHFLLTEKKADPNIEINGTSILLYVLSATDIKWDFVRVLINNGANITDISIPKLIGRIITLEARIKDCPYEHYEE